MKPFAELWKNNENRKKKNLPTHNSDYVHVRADRNNYYILSIRRTEENKRGIVHEPVIRPAQLCVCSFSIRS